MAATGHRNPFGPTGGGFFLIPATDRGRAVRRHRGQQPARLRRLASQARAEDEARRRVDEERLRIARELHDVVAHTMATINVQASVADHCC